MATEEQRVPVEDTSLILEKLHRKNRVVLSLYLAIIGKNCGKKER
jgi:hypothetical protein